MGVPVWYQGSLHLGGIVNPIPPDLPQVASSTLLLNLQADTLLLNDGDPVSIWVGTDGHAFTAEGSARPTYRILNGYSTIVFDGIDDYLLGQNWIELDNLPSFATFTVCSLSLLSPNGHLLNKIDEYYTGQGWYVPIASIGVQSGANYLFGGSAFYTNLVNLDRYDVWTCELLGLVSGVNQYVDGDDSTFIDESTGGVVTYTTTEPVRLGALPVSGSLEYSLSRIRAMMFYAPAPNASDRAAIEAWLAARYGVSLP